MHKRLVPMGFGGNERTTQRGGCGGRGPMAGRARQGVPAMDMGHVSPVSTAVYLTITADLKDEASRRFGALAAPVWTKAGP